MTQKAAINELEYQEDMRSKGIDYQVNNLVIKTAILALEKQIPKKPIVDPTNLCEFQNFRCPKCNKKIISRVDGEWVAGSLQGYCDDCGQRLDWSEEE